MSTLSKPQNKLLLSFSAKSRQIRVGTGVIRILGDPEYVSLRINDTWDMIAILPCEGTDLMSFKVPDGLLSDSRRQSLRINSKLFVDMVLSHNNLDTETIHSVKGMYSESENAVLFPLYEVGLQRKTKKESDPIKKNKTSRKKKALQ